MAFVYPGELKKYTNDSFFDYLTEQMSEIFVELAKLGNTTAWFTFSMDTGIVEVYGYKRFPIPPKFADHELFTWISATLLDQGYFCEMKYCQRDHTCTFQISWA